MRIFQKALIGLMLCSAMAFPKPASADTFESYTDKERFQIRVRAIGIFADGDGQVNGTALETNVGDAVTPEVDFTYFFTDTIAAELIAATAQHEVTAGNFDLGETYILPPTLTLQYHFQRHEKFSPYVGAGINYSYFYGEDDGTGFDNLDVDGGFGLALQAGADYWLDDHWGLNVDVKYIDIDIESSVTLSGTGLRADDVELNPFIVGAGVSYRF